MAGAGTKLFTAGSRLTAAQVNTYLMDQVVARFADSAARDAAYGGAGEPVLAEGMLCYLDSENAVFVNINGTSGGWQEVGFDSDLGISTKTVDYTAALNDKNTIIQMNIASANTLTIPLNSAVAFDIGSQFLVAQYGAGKTSIAGDAGVTLRPGTSSLRTQYSVAALLKVATNEWYVYGDILGSADDSDQAILSGRIFR